MSPSEFRAIRLALGLTQADFADAVGVTRTYVGLLERGQKPISRRIADAAIRATPKPLNLISAETDPILREIELTLIRRGISFEKNFQSESEIFDFFLNEFSLGIVIQRDHMTALRKTRDVRDIIVANGKLAAEAISMLIDGKSLRLLKPKSISIKI